MFIQKIKLCGPTLSTIFDFIQIKRNLPCCLKTFVFFFRPCRTSLDAVSVQEGNVLFVKWFECAYEWQERGIMETCRSLARLRVNCIVSDVANGCSAIEYRNQTTSPMNQI